MSKNLILFREENLKMVSDIFKALEIDFLDTTELQRQLLAAFTFGMIYSKGKDSFLSPADVHALSILSLQDSFKYSVEQAAEYSAILINVASNMQEHNLLNAVIHRGGDGYFQWKKEEIIMLKNNLKEILVEIQKISK